METKVKKREWVKTALIIFLAVLLVLTFFSNTIMNASLPEVAAQQTKGGAINAKIRGSGMLSANETYDVTISQTRRIGSVKIREGQTVNAGEIGIAFAAAVVYMVPGILMFLHGESYLVEGITHAGSVKE